jgi:hypothetical protein
VRNLASSYLYSYLLVDLTRFATIIQLEHSIRNSVEATVQQYTHCLIFVDYYSNTNTIAVRLVQFTTISNATIDKFSRVIVERNSSTLSKQDY